MVYDPNLWYIHGNTYDLHEFVDKHPGGRMALLTGRGRDCTALFESYHPWNDKHRKILRAYGAAPPPPDPFYEEIKAGVREAFPEGCGSTKMRTHAMIGLAAAWSLMMWLFFVVATPLSSLLAGCLVATVATRLSHEGGHWQISRKEWVNRLALFLGFFIVGPSMCWYYQHVVSHHVSTNQDKDAEKDVDVEYIWIADKFPGWLKVLSLPGIFIGTVIEIGVKRWWAQGGLPCMWLTAGAIFVPCSQVAHVILYPDSGEHESWAKMQIAESVDFASESDFWFHTAFGLTTQIEHHLFPGIGHHCYDTCRKITRKVCEKHGVHHSDVSASTAFGQGP
ncbi:Acyl-lipid omega-13 desaturase (CrDES) (Omega13 fatty acid desaturase) [Durusdinium trenchii]|uniref:Acyl-lipid omega-13 desaturase (CrDES) (Omega13 fatty acid desaturase) n=1 Tax=Durusdinium trenchii TaxID=1381693 RepID=A0ABP0MW28_9DINO